jgi:CHASE2 domain-containing sensor protein
LNALPIEAVLPVSRSFCKPYRAAVVLAAAVALLVSFTPAGHRLEDLLPELTSHFIPEARQTTAVSVVAIDAASLDAYGAWPWPHDQLARVIERLAAFHPKVIGFLPPLTAAETPRNLVALRDTLDSLDKPLQPKAAAWLRQLDTDAQLHDALKRAGNVLLAAPYVPRGVKTPPHNLQHFAVQAETGELSWQQAAWRLLASARTLTGIHIDPPLETFLHSASGIGLVTAYSEGQRVQATPLSVAADGQALPTMELALLAAMNNVAARELRTDPETGLLGARTKRFGHANLTYYPRPAAVPPVHSLLDIMQADSAARALRNKAVLLGLSAPGLAPSIKGPAGRVYTPLTWTAQMLGSLLDKQVFITPDWFYAAERGLFVLLALYLLLLPTGWQGSRGLVSSGLLAVGLLNAGVLALIVHNLWIPVVGPALFVLATQLLLSLAYRRQRALSLAHQATVDARLALGSNLQAQGQLDLAMEQFVQCLPERAALEPLYELGLEYERRRQAGRARAVYERLEQNAMGFRDAAQRLSRLTAMAERFPSSTTPSTSKTLVLDNPVMELPVLGRYRLERELGRGAMGTVYLATDPTISRELAIKTLPLAGEHAGGEQQAITERFFKEAEAVGRLNHPNIVAIHDAGREHDLAYIAMDYVQGQSLDTWTGRSSLLPVWEILDIAAQVADALAYAHSRNVVHRDIKPGNIIYDRNSGIAKITDFGVARLLDSSGTRTGTVLGTPSYMSPEQVAGKKTDGRSDLFSLGVTLYQLLTGSLPFEGDSIATLMYQIANQKTPSLRKARRSLPVCVARLVSKALQKDAAKRFADGEAMAVAILNCRAQFKGGRRKTA